MFAGLKSYYIARFLFCATPYVNQQKKNYHYPPKTAFKNTADYKFFELGIFFANEG